MLRLPGGGVIFLTVIFLDTLLLGLVGIVPPERLKAVKVFSTSKPPPTRRERFVLPIGLRAS